MPCLWVLWLAQEIVQAAPQAAPQVTQHVTQDPTIIAGAIAAAIVLVLSSLGGTAVLIINAWSSANDRREAAAERRIQLELTQSTNKHAVETAVKTDTLLTETAKIHELTNSTNSKLQAALELKNSELDGMKALLLKMVEEKRETAAMRVVTDLQTAAATAALAARRGERKTDVVNGEPASPAAEATLQKIETNTAATADAVKDLKP